MGLGVGVVLLALPFIGHSDTSRTVDVPAGAAGAPPLPDATDFAGLEPVTASASPTVTPSSASPSPASSPSPTPTPTPSATPTPSLTPLPVRRSASPTPVLLGPDSNGQLSNMVERYCDRHVSGSSWADARSDGRWECQRGLLASSRIVDMNVACSDTYGAGAFAQNPGTGAYGWRCYRSS